MRAAATSLISSRSPVWMRRRRSAPCATSSGAPAPNCRGSPLPISSCHTRARPHRPSRPPFGCSRPVWTGSAFTCRPTRGAPTPHLSRTTISMTQHGPSSSASAPPPRCRWSAGLASRRPKTGPGGPPCLRHQRQSRPARRPRPLRPATGPNRALHRRFHRRGLERLKALRLVVAVRDDLSTLADRPEHLAAAAWRNPRLAIGELARVRPWRGLSRTRVFRASDTLQRSRGGSTPSCVLRGRRSSMEKVSASHAAAIRYFNALIGSTRDARCAGMKPAHSATSASATAESASTAGSAPVI